MRGETEEEQQRDGRREQQEGDVEEEKGSREEQQQKAGSRGAPDTLSGRPRRGCDALEVGRMDGMVAGVAWWRWSWLAVMVVMV